MLHGGDQITLDATNLGRHQQVLVAVIGLPVPGPLRHLGLVLPHLLQKARLFTRFGVVVAGRQDQGVVEVLIHVEHQPRRGELVLLRGPGELQRRGQVAMQIERE